MTKNIKFYAGQEFEFENGEKWAILHVRARSLRCFNEREGERTFYKGDFTNRIKKSTTPEFAKAEEVSDKVRTEALLLTNLFSSYATVEDVALTVVINNGHEVGICKRNEYGYYQTTHLFVLGYEDAKKAVEIANINIFNREPLESLKIVMSTLKKK